MGLTTVQRYCAACDKQARQHRLLTYYITLAATSGIT